MSTLIQQAVEGITQIMLQMPNMPRSRLVDEALNHYVHNLRDALRAPYFMSDHDWGELSGLLHYLETMDNDLHNRAYQILVKTADKMYY